MTDPTNQRPHYTLSPDSVRRNALELAVRDADGKFRDPDTIVRAAAAFEAYLRDGFPTQPAGPLLPPDLVSVAINASADRLFVVQLVLAERERQVAKGWTPDHDDEHTAGELASEAARAIIVPGTLPYAALPGVGWVRDDGDRVQELVQGVALAVAEIERLLRVNAKAEERTHGPESAVNDCLGRPGTVA